MSETQIVVFGDSMSAFDTALSFAKIGIKTSLITGDIAHAEWPIDGVRDTDGVVRNLITEVMTPLDSEQTGADSSEASYVVAASPDSETLIPGADGNLHPLPEMHLFGVPANVFDKRVAQLTGSTLRAYADRLLPIFGLGKYRSLYDLTAKRLGKKLADTMVAPLLRARFGVSPESADIDVIAPALNGAITRAGSLSGAVLELCALEKQGDWVRPAVGWQEFREYFLERLRAFNVDVNPDRFSSDTLNIYDGYYNLPETVDFPGVRSVLTAVVPRLSIAGDAVLTVAETAVTITSTASYSTVRILGNVDAPIADTVKSVVVQQLEMPENPVWDASFEPVLPATEVLAQKRAALHADDPEQIIASGVWLIGPLWHGDDVVKSVIKQRATATVVRRMIAGIA